MKRWKLSPTTWVAVALIVVAVLAASAYVACDAFDNWAPNVATDAVVVFDFWRAGLDEVDNPRGQGKDGVSWLLADALDFVQRTQRVADSDRDNLPADLVVAIDNLSVLFQGRGDTVRDLAAEARGRPGLDDWLLNSISINAQVFGQVLRSHVDTSFELWPKPQDPPSEFEQPNETGADQEGDGEK
jgi:hypothetical protein